MTMHQGGFPHALRPGRISLIGIPLEKGAGAMGTLMGPAALRTAGLVGRLADLGHEVVDHGDILAPAPVMPAFSAEASGNCRHLGEITAWTRAIHQRAYAMACEGGVPVFMGGDHSISMGTVSGIARRCAETGRELAVLWLDAHADFNTPATTPSGNMHGMSVAFLAGDRELAPILGDAAFPPIDPANIHLFGIRSLDRAERAALIARGVDIVDMRQIDETSVARQLAPRLEELRRRNVHLHVSLDADFLDPSVAPGVGTAVPGGTTFREAHLVMEMIHDTGLLGSLDLVELNPFLDERGRTANLVADLAASAFGLTTIGHRVGA